MVVLFVCLNFTSPHSQAFFPLTLLIPDFHFFLPRLFESVCENQFTPRCTDSICSKWNFTKSTQLTLSKLLPTPLSSPGKLLNLISLLFSKYNAYLIFESITKSVDNCWLFLYIEYKSIYHFYMFSDIISFLLPFVCCSKRLSKHLTAVCDL